MDNLTHSLVGLTAAKAGVDKLSPGATTLCVLAANSPDADILVLIFRGRWAFLEHHRGITHSIVGAALLALALPLVFYFGDRIIAQIRKREPQVKLGGLLIASILSSTGRTTTVFVSCCHGIRGGPTAISLSLSIRSSGWCLAAPRFC